VFKVHILPYILSRGTEKIREQSHTGESVTGTPRMYRIVTSIRLWRQLFSRASAVSCTKWGRIWL